LLGAFTHSLSFYPMKNAYELLPGLIRWIKDQQKSEGVTSGEDVYIILRLDGRVRRSGKVIMTNPSCVKNFCDGSV